MIKPKLLVIASNYPSENNLYGSIFIHTRLKQYTKYFNIQVLCCQTELQNNESFIYENINVFNASSKDEFYKFTKSISYDIVIIHFVTWWMHDFIKSFYGSIFIWIHGIEVISWIRLLFDFELQNLFKFIKNILSNIYQMFFMHRLFRYSNIKNNIHFIFISNWIYKIAKIDTLSNIKNYSIIPNPIDCYLFNYNNKNPEQRKKILLIRSFDSRKYANDIAIKAIKLLIKDRIFSDLEFAIYGKGKYFNKLTYDLKFYDNIKLYNTFLFHKDIPLIHKNYGVFLCPTRYDTQGVSMCEAMSSGLVPITSNNSAIPEFVINGISGFYAKSANNIANLIKTLYNNPDTYSIISKNASKSIIEKTNISNIIIKEINLILNIN